MLPILLQEFRNRFNHEPAHVFFCPGRVNLIGEHIDYNGGKVMPCAINYGTWLAISKNIDKRFRFQSLDFPEKADLHVQESYSRSGKEWFNYPLGVIHGILQEGHGLSGLDMFYAGNLPIGAGLSSSASVEVLTGFALNELFGLGISLKDLALLCKKVENEFIGVNSGIMDQFAVAMGKKSQAILLDCNSLDFGYIPFETRNYSLVIMNSNKARTLAESKYNERFAECGAVLKKLKQALPVDNLCDITPKKLEANIHLIGDPVLERRSRHVVNEQERVLIAAKALQSHDLIAFGKLMYASHKSLKELYEVSGMELDTLVHLASKQKTCIGARMTGAGFGGCAVALVETVSTDEFSDSLTREYEKEIGYPAALFTAKAVDGVNECDLRERQGLS